MRGTPESNISRAIQDYLSLKKHFWLRLNTMGVYDQKLGRYRPSPATLPGTADLLVIHQTNPVFLEVKAPKGKQSADQKLFEELCKEYGVEYYVVRSVDEVQDLGL